VGDEATQQTMAAIGEEQCDFDGLAQEALEFEVGVGGETVEGVAVVLRQTFFTYQAVR